MPTFSQPLWLLLALPLLYLLFRIQRNSFAPAGFSRRLMWLSVRILLVSLLLAALAGFELRSSVRQKQIVFLLDLSDSIDGAQKKKEIEWFNQLSQRVHAPDQLGIVTFGGQAEVERFPGHSRLLETAETHPDGSSTNFAAALKLADAIFAGNYQKNLVIVSDGLENSGDSEPEFRRMQKKGVTTQALYLSSGYHAEAAIDGLRFPRQVGLNEAFNLEAVISSNHRTPALLRLFRNGVLIQEGSITLQQGSKELIHLPQKISDPGIYRYELKLIPDTDYRTENNAQEGWIFVQGPARFLLVDDQPADLQPLAQALRNRGFEVDLKSARNFPLTLQDMLLYQGIMVRNVSASQIHVQMPLLRKYVDDFGGGFAMLGGKKSFGPGGYFDTPVEEILPVRMDLQNKKYLADIAMVIVIDKSGSMSFADRGRQKIDLADEGGARVASLLKKSDQLGVIAVDSVPKWAFPLQKLDVLERAVEAITSIRAGGGGIYVYSGLKEAYGRLRETKASVKHVILFADTADCEEKDGPSGDSSLWLAQRALAEDKITTTTIGIGQSGDSDVEFLRQVATLGEGRFYFTNDMYTLPEIFTQESAVVQRFYINEERFTPRFSEREPLLTGIDSIPDLLGYVATSAKPLSSMALLSHHQEPVLGFWRHGLGQTIAFTSDPAGGWSSAWLSWPAYERFWNQVGRYLAQAPEPANFRASVAQHEDNTTVIAEAIDEHGQFVRDAQFGGILISGNGEEVRLDFTQTAAGRYEATFRQKGTLFGKIYRLRGNTREETIVQIAAPENPEYRIGAGGHERLEKLTGKVLDNPADLRFENKTTTEIQPLRDKLLFWAAILFLIDVALRKVDFRSFRIQPAPAVAAQPSHLAGLKFRTRAPVRVLVTVELPEILVEPVEIPGKDLPKDSAEENSQYMERLKAAKKRNK